MGAQSVNLVFRFLLEILSLLFIGIWSYRLVPNGWNYFFAVLVPILVSTAWSVFNVPGDPSRSGAAPVVVPGVIRLLLELSVFGFGMWACSQVYTLRWALFFGGLVLGHYLISHDRIAWLVQQ